MLQKMRSARFLAEVVRLDVVEECRRARQVLLLGAFGARVAASASVVAEKGKIVAPGMSLDIGKAEPAPYPGAAWTAGGNVCIAAAWPPKRTRAELAAALAERRLSAGDWSPEKIAGWPDATLIPAAGDGIAFAIGKDSVCLLDANGRLWRAPLTSARSDCDDETSPALAEAA